MSRTPEKTHPVTAATDNENIAVGDNTALKDRIASQIRSAGPISVDNFMAACLGDARAGYYQHGDPFGVTGDFITAPEISGLFGEMCGLGMQPATAITSVIDEVISCA